MAVHYLEESRSTTDIKKRKIEGKESIDKMFLSIKNEEFRVSESGTVINGRSGLVTPSKSNDEKVREISGVGDGSEMDTREDECPCGYFHGPGESGHHDIRAVGFTSQPLLRGPD
ncbi:DEHA2F19184p [Debaryomyces hansenii CBS767]|jgi:hypothetical protein|uniref:DEHA2F19184p n=1 Tax=Debaryomyces hansenii (strain ATCC 36239 / CBS 767 / BCRC 21394 / JCM 1990 / NBRC 0083 / IGC 2968) TaxID=284592 RepID=Q6BKU2_DEBHA|nr:DEHA2F19184p [Debaryomyces hansenii CBS767]CAG89564.1 DEHA2F19184p [Debaryomyces hansenii CBS767]|eukprot:XP_461179.1 DEHA2F19184p [Debaryomyces hansenii CBS767]